MKKTCRRVSTLLLGAFIAAPLSGWAESAFTDDKISKPEVAQEQKRPALKDRQIRENTPMPKMQIAPPGADMPIIIQDKPVKAGIVKLI